VDSVSYGRFMPPASVRFLDTLPAFGQADSETSGAPARSPTCASEARAITVNPKKVITLTSAGMADRYVDG